MIYKSSMTSGRQSPTNRTYLISITAPQSVADICTRLQGVLMESGLTDAPVPPGIPLIQTIQDPGPPVPGRLPPCDTPLIMAGDLSGDDWISWPVESSGWLEELTRTLVVHAEENLVSTTPEQLFTTRAGIPLAKRCGKNRNPDLASTEVSKILENIPGWRALNLVCWSVEYLASRPWYQSAAWYPLWHRRLRRAPLSTNINKNT